MKADARQEFFRRMQEINPQPKSDLQYSTPFELLIAVILSAQATDKSVNVATAKLFPLANTPAAILALGEEMLSEYIKTIGLFRSKAKNVIKACEILLAQHGGEVPSSREALEALPGVGRKTANVVLNIAFGQPTMAVDTHIFRISNRMGMAPGKDVLAVEEKLLKVVPDQFRMHAHHWLILHGRYTCVARKPKCGACPVYDICGFRKKADYVE
ncbi:MAG: endonuclease III [Burkholderiales bacterium]|nr:endonuclease III [Rhodocyclaceae bacterium]MCA3058134.1 endonuclease III [Rhodocyclaceae bacterium]